VAQATMTLTAYSRSVRLSSRVNCCASGIVGS
jgi:hypothetical protein